MVERFTGLRSQWVRLLWGLGYNKEIVFSERDTSDWLKSLLPPATKLGHSNVFTGVCDSVNRMGCLLRGVCLVGGVPGPGRRVSAPGGGRGVLGPRGMSGPGGMSAVPGGCLLSGACLLPGGLVLGRGVCSGGAWWRHLRDGHCCGRYASYWNAFLSNICALNKFICNVPSAVNV